MIELLDQDYTLDEGGGWFDTHNGFLVRIHATEEGVIVDIYDSKKTQDGYDFDSALISGTSAHINDLDAP